jgi:hypothetical protein
LTFARECGIIVSEKGKEITTMTHITLCENFERTYKNNGQHLEQWFRFTLTGKIEKADNIAHDKGTDLLHYSVKSARATVCKGTDLTTYLNTDKATEFVYITANGIAYIMNRIEYTAFVETFGTVTTESAKNGGHKKIRLGHETAKLLEWLATA